MPFVKGQSGNPSGRPRGVKATRHAAKLAALSTLMEIVKNVDEPANTRVEAAGLILGVALRKVNSEESCQVNLN